MQQKPERYVVVSSRKWGEMAYESLADDIRQRTVLISKKEEFTEAALTEISPAYVFILHWSHIVPDELLDRFECIIFHMTDLPYGRGGSPLQNLILRGHTVTQVSAIKCVKELDAGPVYCKSPLSLEGSARQIFARLAPVTVQMIEGIIENRPIPQPQQGEPVHFRRRRHKDGDLSVAKSLREAYDLIRMLDSEDYPSAYIETCSLKLEFSEGELDGDALVAKVVLRSLGNI